MKKMVLEQLKVMDNRDLQKKRPKIRVAYNSQSIIGD